MFKVIKLKELYITPDDDDDWFGGRSIKQLFDYSFLNDENFTRTFSNINNIDLLNLDERSSWTHKKKFSIYDDDIEYDGDDFYKTLNVNNDLENYQLLKYEKGDFFNKHKDRKLGENHKYTLLIFFNDNKEKLEGGELILSDDSNTFKIEFDNSKIDKPIMVIFSIDLYHKVEPVKSGTRYVLKKPLYINDVDKQSDDESDNLGDNYGGLADSGYQDNQQEEVVNEESDEPYGLMDCGHDADY